MNYLSSKFNFDTSENKLSQILREVKLDSDFIDLTISNPTLVFDYESEKIKSILMKPNLFPYSPDPQGSLEARLAIKDYYKKRGREINEEYLFLTSGTSEAISFILKSICEPNSEIIVPTPGYPLYDFLFNLENGNGKYYKLISQNTDNPNKLHWKLDFNSLKNSINPNTKAIILVEPHNPLGSRLSKEDTKKIKEIVREKNLILILDEVFSDYMDLYYENDSYDGINCIYLNGLSKTLTLPQLKLSWLYLRGNESFLSQMKLALEIICDAYLSVNTLVQKALSGLFEITEDLQNTIKQRIQSNFKIIESTLSNLKNIRYYLPDGGWNFLIKIDTDLDDEEFACLLLQKEKTYLFPGFMFDLEEGPWFVISLLTKEKDLKEGLKRIIQCIRKNSQLS